MGIGRGGGVVKREEVGLNGNRWIGLVWEEGEGEGDLDGFEGMKCSKGWLM